MLKKMKTKVTSTYVSLCDTNGKEIVRYPSYSTHMSHDILLGVALTRASAEGKNLTKIDLCGHSISGAWLDSNDMSSANIDRTNWNRCAIYGKLPIFDRVQFENCLIRAWEGSGTAKDFSTIRIYGSTISGLPIIPGPTPIDGWSNCFAYQDPETQLLRVRIGCRNFTLAEAVKHWRTKKYRDEVRAVVEFFATAGKDRGWRGCTMPLWPKQRRKK